MPIPVEVTPKFIALQYNGSNSAQIIEMIPAADAPTIVSESGGVLTVSPGPAPYGQVTVNAGQYLVYWCEEGHVTPKVAVDNLADYAVLG